MKKKLILFDFDGTITTKDTFIEFIKYYHGVYKLISGLILLSPILILYKLKIIANWRAKEIVLRWFFKGEDAKTFNTRSEEFCKEVIPKLIRPKAWKEIENHLSDGADVVIITASAENWVRPWCERHGINCVATKLCVSGNTITGKIEGINCYGAEKEKRILELYTLTDFEEVVAYGDSAGDNYMLALAHKKFYKPFR